ncbi:hypothetical protein D1007_31277 [Hordeum vulgare]|nr:hypothetical protein D1007_31277 [Hordeum vulgare]
MAACCRVSSRCTAPAPRPCVAGRGQQKRPTARCEQKTPTAVQSPGVEADRPGAAQGGDVDVSVIDTDIDDHQNEPTNESPKIQGLDKHIKIACDMPEFKRGDRWQDLDIMNWTVVEQFQKPLQTDGMSCGLFMLNFMEYWIGELLSDQFTQEDMKEFRQKLAIILLETELNKLKGSPIYYEPDNEEKVSDSDVELLDDRKRSLLGTDASTLTFEHFPAPKDGPIGCDLYDVRNDVRQDTSIGDMVKRLVLLRWDQYNKVSEKLRERVELSEEP